jgi:hypothetical protein
VRNGPRWAALLFTLALAFRLLPGGTMLAPAPGVLNLSVTLCAGTMAGTPITIEVDRDRPDHAGDDRPAPCAFASLLDAALDPPGFAAALLGPLLPAPVALQPFAARPPASAAWLRPPLRGPPLPA